MPSQNDLLEIDLDLFTDDLLEGARNRPARQLLFQVEKGNWQPINVIGAAVPELLAEFQRIRDLTPRGQGNLYVSWLDFPSPKPKESDALVIFLLEDTHWSKTVYFNRNKLAKRPTAKETNKAKPPARGERSRRGPT